VNSLSFVLPPRNTLFNLSLSTGLSLLASYANPDIQSVITADKLELLHRPSDSELYKAIDGLVKDLIQGSYGLMPPLGPDSSRLRNLRDHLSKVTDTSVELRAGDLLKAYVGYASKLAEKRALVDELERAFSEFKDGYPHDAKICDVPMLNVLAPEFMEGIRTLGTIGFKSVSDRYSFSKMRIGLHSTCLGIVGLWTSLIAMQGNLEYFVFPHLSTLAGVKIRVGDLRDNEKRLAQVLRRCVPRNIPSLALAVALSTVGIQPYARKTVLVIVQIGGRRVDLMEQGLPLSLDTLLVFADKLYEKNERAHKRLLNLVIEGLKETPEQRARKLHEVGLKAAQLIYLALTQVLRPSETLYELARSLYAHRDMEFEDYAKKIGAFLTPYDVECIFSTIEEVLAEARF
jgi:hypothetical protein